MKRIVLMVLSISLLSGCAASNWALNKTEDRKIMPYVYPEMVNKLALVSDWLVVDLNETATPEAFSEKYKKRISLCINRTKDFEGIPAEWLAGGKANSRRCLVGENTDHLQGLETKNGLRDFFLLKNFAVGVRFYPHSTGSYSVCTECEKLEPITSKVIEAYKFDTQLFYLKLADQRWVRFTPKNSSRIRNFKPAFVDEQVFLAEKRKPKKMEFVPISPGHYFHISLPLNMEYVFYSDSPIIQNEYSINRLILTRRPEEPVYEKGSALYYALLPITIPVDIVTLPIQWFMLMKATTSKN